VSSVPVESNGRPDRTSGADFDSALERAESLLQEADRARDRFRILCAAQVMLPLAITVALAIAIGVSGVHLGRAVTTTLITWGIAALLDATIHVALVLPVRRRVGRDERVMLEIVGMLRELLMSVAEDEKWSASRLRLAKARIARFPIGSSGGSR
jgi:hypothetical protein